VDGVALASVISSASVAVVATAAQVITAVGDRRAARRMKRDELSWEAKASALQHTADVAARMRRLLSASLLHFDSAELAEGMHAALTRIDDQLGMVEMYSSPEVSAALDSVLLAVRDLQPGSADKWRAIDLVRKQKEVALGASDWDRAAALLARERALLAEVGFPNGTDTLRILRGKVESLIGVIRKEVSSS
jgi:hypothetical protein